MKQCAKCNRTYVDGSLNFCLDDGVRLVPAFNAEATQRISLDDADPRFSEPTLVDGYPQQPAKIATINTKLRYLIAALLALILLCGVGILLKLGDKERSDPSKSAQEQTNPQGHQPKSELPQSPSDGASVSDNRARLASTQPNALIDIITAQQKIHVKKSYGEGKDENFSKKDLVAFIANREDSKIKEELRVDPDFLAVVAAIRMLSLDQRQKLLDTGLNTFKKTWGELGLNPKRSTPEMLAVGQTSAGQEAERLIAEAIVTLVKEIIISQNPSG